MSRLRPLSNAESSRLSTTSEDLSRQHASSPDDVPSLAPPRPPFMTPANRSSWSSVTFSVVSENPESDRERYHTTTTTLPSPRALSPAPISRNKLRKSTSGVDYPPPSAYPDIQEVPDEYEMSRPPPSSFSYPFLSHPGNPDPLPARRTSIDSSHERPSSAQGERDNDTSPSPYAPQIYRNSVAGNLAQDSQTHLPRVQSVPTFRSPFLSPASRPSSTIWTPPIQPIYGAGNTPNTSMPQLGTVRKSKPPMASTMLPEKLSKQDKPWLNGRKGDRSRLSWWLTVLMWFLGLCGGAVKVYFDYKSIRLLDDSQLCPVFVENFDSLNLDDWTADIQLGGFGSVYFLLPPFDRSNAPDQQ